MKSVVIKGELRKSLGKKDAKKLRLEEKAPAVLYGSDEPVHFSVSFAELRQLVYTPSVYLIDLDIDGTVYKALMQDIQWHPVDEVVLHVDFLQINDDKSIKINVPVKVEGFAKGIKKGGKLNTTLRRLSVRALAANLPDTIDIDVTKLDIGETIKVGDLNLPGVELLDPKSNVIVSVSITRAAKSAAGGAEEEGEGEGEGEEGAEAEASESTEE
ncbi:50S ribosomal protein L25/general stress protein Ctc [Draconibacterium halophilum]|uniref:Large ribosomal subunit protein bL25 n=1 Tax=Draconibacterium halophilum TaxID=2706887 RepID=A0A6C0RGY9_9BACT|nr:50S ribosomal protein L25/general stress protein Ctc [Draconibacterium halophilum]QIA08935.1 50S ribosomal protein L25/general stress protein Ctc [Draconibacterium halophilum]